MKNIRLWAAFALIIVVVLAAQGGVGAWTARQQATEGAALAEASPRLQGTVKGKPDVPVAPTCNYLQTYCVETLQAGLISQAITELPAGVTVPEGKKLVPTRMIQITGEGKNTDKDIIFSLSPQIVESESVAFWDGSVWTELTINEFGKYVIPAGAALPLIIAVFTS